MTIKLNPERALAAVAVGSCVVAWAMIQSFVGTVYATEKAVAQHQNQIVGIEAIRPQVQDILIKVDSMEKAIRDIRDMRDRNCNFKKHRGE